ncbi:protoporphyrinogen oxidase [bacterium]|nr:protoporphyrinogen oxidase [bacterium]
MSAEPSATRHRIAILGAGLTGLASAHRLLELADERNLPLDIAVFDAGQRCGGIVGTVERDGYLIDTGADSFITNKPGALGLCQRLGLADRLQATDARYRGALVLSKGRPQPVPEGFQLLSPSAMWPVLRSPILSPWGKLRMGCEYFLPAQPTDEDESLASFVRRRFGAEALDRLVQPLVGGIYTSDPERLSLAATMPRFQEMEREYGSLIRAAYATKPTKSDDRTSSGARYGLFAGLQGGMQELVDTLTQRIQPQVAFKLGWRATSLMRSGETENYQLDFENGQQERFSSVILAIPPARIADLIAGFDAPFSQALRQIESASSAIVVTGHNLSEIAHPLNAFGLVIPHRERRRILAVSFSSRKFPNRAPAGKVLLRTFVGGALQPELFALDDAALEQLVLEELRDTLGVTGAPDFSMIVRYPAAMPQYTLGHRDRVATIEKLQRQHPHLEIAGNSYHGVGVPDSIHSGEQAAERILTESTGLFHQESGN